MAAAAASLVIGDGIYRRAQGDPVDMNISLFPDADGLSVTGTQTVTVTVSPAPQNGVDVSIDGVALPHIAAPPFQWTWDTLQVADGTHNISATATYRTRKSRSSISVTTANTAKPPDPSATGYNGVGVIMWGGGYTSTQTNKQAYSLAGVGDGEYSTARTAMGTGPNKHVLQYGTFAQVPTIGTSATWPVDLATARANGWLLYTAGGKATGKEFHYTGGGGDGYLANIANSTYRTTWGNNVNASITARPGCDGIHIDNLVQNVMEFSFATSPAPSYPLYNADGTVAIADAAAYKAAMVQMIQTVGPIIKSAGNYCLVNGGVTSDDTGALAKAWIQNYGTYVSGVEIEYWIQNPNNVAQMSRSGNQFFYDYWEGKTSVADTVQSLGADFWPLVYFNSGDTQRIRYARASWLMYWNGTTNGGLSGFPNVVADIWNAELGKKPGTPTAARTQLANGVYYRPYTAGPAYINTTYSAQTLPDGTTLASGDARIPG